MATLPGAARNGPYRQDPHPPRGRGARGSVLLGGRYQLTGPLGGGSPADSHRAIDVRLNRPVVVTLFPPGQDRTGERRFQDEAQTLANLNHPGLVAVYDFAVERTCSYLVTELVEGSTLRSFLDRERLPAAEVARMGADIANALAYLHDHGVVHGHLSPSSVVLDPSRGVRLTGFGFAPLLDATGLGSPDVAPYVAPEQGHGRAPGPAADVHALGMTLRDSVADHPHDAAGPLRRVLRDMTEAAPASRPTARQVEAMLAPFDTAPVDSAPVEDEGTDHPREEPRGSTTRLVIGLGLVVLLAVLVGAALMKWQDTPEPTRPSAPAQHPAGEPGRSAPSIPGIPSFDAPKLPDMPDIPTALPDMPDMPDMPDVPDVPDSVSEDARSLWTEFTDWLSRTF